MEPTPVWATDSRRTLGPGFIGIGAQKAGTTWLYDNLRHHPSIWMTPIKELHWFDVLMPPRALGGRHTYRHKVGWRRYAPALRNCSVSDLRWIRHFYVAMERSGSYSSLFDHARHMGLLTGEFTPAYAILDSSTVRQVAEILPANCQIVFVMREPVDRLWSGIRMYCKKRGISVGQMSESEIDELSLRPEHFLRSDYARTIENWSVFGNRVGYFFFEHLRESPATFLSDVLRFLGVNDKWRSPRLTTIANRAGDEARLPDRLREKWAKRLRPSVNAVHQVVGTLPDSWCAVANSSVARD